MQHVMVAQMVNTERLNYEKEELEEYLLGSVAADCMAKANNKTPNTERQKTHFVVGEFKRGEEDPHNFEQYTPDLKAFLVKYGNSLSKPFIMGYFVQLATDVFFFTHLLPKKVTEHLKEIKENATSYKDLTNKEYLTWYKKHFYDVFDDGDILLPAIEIGTENLPNFTKFKEYQCPIEEVNSENLHNLIEKLNEKYTKLKEQKTWEYTVKSTILTPKEHFSFVENATDYIVELLANLNVSLNKEENFTPKI